jgi:hypothetical protein
MPVVPICPIWARRSSRNCLARPVIGSRQCKKCGLRFLLGDHIQTTVLEVTEGIVEATYSAQTEPILRRVNLALEKLRLLFRLAKDLRYLDLRRYEFAARSIDEIGRLIGGWIKAGRAAPSH